MSTNTITREQRRAASNVATTARRQNSYTRKVIEVAPLVSDDGYAFDIPLADFAEGFATIIREAGRKPPDFVKNVMHKRGLDKSIVQIQSGHPEEATADLESLGDARAAAWVPKVAEAQKISTAAIEAWQAADEHEKACAAEADKFGGRRAKNPTPEGRLALDRLSEAESAAHSAWMAKVESGNKLAWLISAMTRINFFGAVDDSDLGADDGPPAATSPAPIDWQNAVGVEDTAGPTGK